MNSIANHESERSVKRVAHPNVAGCPISRALSAREVGILKLPR
jgi:hypothetical protein